MSAVSDPPRRAGDRPDLLQRNEFVASPGEKVVRPWITSSLFPDLPKRPQAPFQVGLILTLIGLVGFALLKLPAR